MGYGGKLLNRLGQIEQRDTDGQGSAGCPEDIQNIVVPEEDGADSDAPAILADHGKR